MIEKIQPQSILIVEDEPLLRMLASEVMEGEGLNVLEAGDAATALDMVEAHRELAVLFTDVDMPGMDGLELARRVHSIRPQIELIVTSGKHRYSDRSLPDHGTFLPKPYTLANLLELVQRKLRAARAQA